MKSHYIQNLLTFSVKKFFANRLGFFAIPYISLSINKLVKLRPVV